MNNLTVTTYKITKMRKSDRRIIGFLSPGKSRWVSVKSTKHIFGRFTESEVNEFIKLHETDTDYYYLKTLI